MHRRGEVRRAAGENQRGLCKAGSTRLTQQSSAGVLDPGRGAVGFFGGDAEAAIRLVQQQASQLAGRCVEQQRGVDLQVFNFGVVAGLPLQGRGQRNFGKAGAGKHDGATYHMVGQQRVGLGVDLVLPGVLMLWHGVAQQRMRHTARQQPQRFLRGRVPVAFALPRVGG
ncbi:hypothetical protein D3C71_1646090 [compost metagenome]